MHKNKAHSSTWSYVCVCCIILTLDSHLWYKQSLLKCTCMVEMHILLIDCHGCIFLTLINKFKKTEAGSQST